MWRVAAAQMNSTSDKERNLRVARALAVLAAREGAQVVAFPELFNWRGPSEQEREMAEPLDGPTLSTMAALAREHHLFILAGSILESLPGEERAFNTSVLLNPAGERIATYRKIHLFDVDVEGVGSLRESATRKPGQEVVVDSERGLFGLSVCYDLRFPELYRELTRRGARIHFVPSAFTLMTGKDHWKPLLRARAIENQVYIVAPAQIGKGVSGPANYGHAMILDPWGNILAGAQDREGILVVADLDLGYLEKVRRELPALEHRRL
ncbi:MAG: carbon-nitrogen hydrolase family protein [Candidatus Tectomicrobia bacterium]|uniref:Carbon-nitrogen hydrolase family protein n=1 Tax=Tectimicrobiota bacterium TaxID=2528274 RepID=A0A932GMQ5_UNCTE|nr:carbon-nitrogen hydrolase family protein [Candidatus Tectomicrobia bacterium]